MSKNAFTNLPLSENLLSNLALLNYQSMTEIQAQTLPLILKGEDVITQGKTGSGKTAIFALGILHQLKTKKFSAQAIVICPTRELAEQVANDIRQLARAMQNIKVLTLCGGTPLRPQATSLESGAHIIVGTPGRIQDHLYRDTLDLEHISVLVLDEADRMLEMGFQSEIDSIIEQIPMQRQTLLFSATYPVQINKIAQRIMNKPKQVHITETHDDSVIEQSFYEISSHHERLTALRLLLNHYQPESSVVFCNTKREVKDVTDELLDCGYSTIDIHGDLEQKDRDQALICFTNKSARVLVATDVAARGLDIDNLSAVFNFNLAHETEIHIHRVGRTGRAGSKGLAFSFYSPREMHRIKLLEDVLRRSISSAELPNNSLLDMTPLIAPMATIRIEGGKKQKIRAGDIVGAITKDKQISGQHIGKITVADHWSYVAIEKDLVQTAFKRLRTDKLKGRKLRVAIVCDY